MLQVNLNSIFTSIFNSLISYIHIFVHMYCHQKKKKKKKTVDILVYSPFVNSRKDYNPVQSEIERECVYHSNYWVQC